MKVTTLVENTTHAKAKRLRPEHGLVLKSQMGDRLAYFSTGSVVSA